MRYELIDSGHGRKLERIGEYLVDRQASVALWRPRLSSGEWKKADAFHQRSDTGGGHWEFRRALPESWMTELGGLQLKTKLTSFGHLGFFAEQAGQWPWLVERARAATKEGRKLKVLNLFGYTGASSLALAKAGTEVTHVDAAKGIVDWSRANAELNQIPPENLVYRIDDCLDFLKREDRRGNKYDGVILDPPSYGRGPKKEVFKIEEHIIGLLTAVSRVLQARPSFVHFSCHSPGFTPEVLRNLLYDTLPVHELKAELGEMCVLERSATKDLGRALPSGAFCRLGR